MSGPCGLAGRVAASRTLSSRSPNATPLDKINILFAMDLNNHLMLLMILVLHLLDLAARMVDNNFVLLIGLAARTVDHNIVFLFDLAARMVDHNLALLTDLAARMVDNSLISTFDLAARMVDDSSVPLLDLAARMVDHSFVQDPPQVQRRSQSCPSHGWSSHSATALGEYCSASDDSGSASMQSPPRAARGYEHWSINTSRTWRRSAT